MTARHFTRNAPSKNMSYRVKDWIVSKLEIFGISYLVIVSISSIGFGLRAREPELFVLGTLLASLSVIGLVREFFK